MQARRDGGRGRDPNEIQARVTGRVAPAARRGRGEHAVSQPQTARAARVRVAGSRTATGARQRSAGEKKKGAGSASHQASPTLRHRGTGPAASSGRRLRPLGRRTSIQTRRLGSAPSASAATSSPHSAPQQCDPNDCGGGRAKVAMSVAQEGSRGERRAACLRLAHNVSELGELGEAAARHRGHGLDDVAHHAPRRPCPAAVLDGERNEPPDRKREGVPGG